MTANEFYDRGFSARMQQLIAEEQMQKEAAWIQKGVQAGRTALGAIPRAATRVSQAGGGIANRVGTGWREGGAINRIAASKNIPAAAARAEFQAQQAGLSNAHKYFTSARRARSLARMPQELQGAFMPQKAVNPVYKTEQMLLPQGYSNPDQWHAAYTKALRSHRAQQQKAMAATATPPAAPAAGAPGPGDMSEMWDRWTQRWSDLPRWGQGAAIGGGIYGGTTAATAPWTYVNNRKADWQSEHPILSFLGRTFGQMPKYDRKSYLLPSFLQ